MRVLPPLLVSPSPNLLALGRHRGKDQGERGTLDPRNSTATPHQFLQRTLTAQLVMGIRIGPGEETDHLKLKKKPEPTENETGHTFLTIACINKQKSVSGGKDGKEIH